MGGGPSVVGFGHRTVCRISASGRESGQLDQRQRDGAARSGAGYSGSGTAGGLSCWNPPGRLLIQHAQRLAQRYDLQHPAGCAGPPVAQYKPRPGLLRRSGTCRNFDVSDGLQSNEFNAGAHHRSRSGELFFGGIEGVNAFHPESIRDNPHAPPMAITALQIFNQPVHAGPLADGRVVLTRDITATSAIELTHGDRVFTLGFAAMSPVMPGKNGTRTCWRAGIPTGTRWAAGATPPRQPAARRIYLPGDRLKQRRCLEPDRRAIGHRIQPLFWATWWFHRLPGWRCSSGVHLARTVAIRETASCRT